MHPLTPNLSGLSIEELQSKYNELVKKLTQASRTGNWNLINQINMVLDDYRQELSVRHQKTLEEANKNINFKNIIDIN